MNYQMNLGGKERTLTFQLGTLKYVGQLSGTDPIAFGGGLVEDPGKLYRSLETIIHAGLLMNYESREMDVDFSAKEVEKWVSALSTGKGLKVLTAYTQAFAGDDEEEENDPNVKKLPRKK